MKQFLPPEFEASNGWRRWLRADLAGRGERWLVRLARAAGCSGAQVLRLEADEGVCLVQAPSTPPRNSPPRDLLSRPEAQYLLDSQDPAAVAWLQSVGAERALLLRLTGPDGRAWMFVVFDPPVESLEREDSWRSGAQALIDLDREQQKKRWNDVHLASLQQRLRAAERRESEARLRALRHERLGHLRDSLRGGGNDTKQALRIFAESIAAPEGVAVLLAHRAVEGFCWVVRSPLMRKQDVETMRRECAREHGDESIPWHAIDAPLPLPETLALRPNVIVEDGLRVAWTPASDSSALDPGLLVEAVGVLAAHLRESEAAEARRVEDAERERLLQELRAGLQMGPKAGDSFEDFSGAARWLWDLRQKMRADASVLLLQEGDSITPLALTAIDGDPRQLDAFLRWSLRRFAREHSTEIAYSARVQEVRADGSQLSPARESFPLEGNLGDWRSRIAVPFRGPDGGIGLLGLGSRTPQKFAPEVVSALRHAAAAASRQLPVARRRERERLTRLQSVLGHLRTGVLLVDDAGAVLVANRAVREMLALDDDAFADLARFESASGIGLSLAIEEAQSSASHVKLDLDQVAGRPREFHLEVTPVETGPRDPGTALITFTDVTEQKQFERAQAEFVGIVSHELRTPLTSMRTAVELVRTGEAGDVSSQQRQFLTMTLRNIDRLGRLVQQLLDSAKQDAGGLVLRRGRHSVASVLAPSLSALSAEAEKNQRELRLELPDSVLAHIDPVRFVEVLDNLAGNALKFTDAGGLVQVRLRGSVPAPRTTTRAMAEKLGLNSDGVELEVRDNGRGMAATARDQAFERFYQEGDPLADRPDGIGLGLHITRTLIEAHDGEIGLESEPGKGTCFSVWIPADADMARLHGGLRRLRQRLGESVTRLEGAVIEAHWLDATAQEEFGGLDVLDAGATGLTVRVRSDLAIRIRRPDRESTPNVAATVLFPREGRRLGTLLALLIDRAVAQPTPEPVHAG